MTKDLQKEAQNLIDKTLEDYKIRHIARLLEDIKRREQHNYHDRAKIVEIEKLDILPEEGCCMGLSSTTATQILNMPRYRY